MATVGPALTCNGYNPATGRCASTSVPSWVPANQVDAYMSGQYGTASTTPQDAETPAAGGSIGSYVSSFLGMLGGNNFTGNDSIASDIGAAAKSPTGQAMGATVGTVSSLLGIVTDLPRLGTILIGGLLLAAGLFALAGGNKIIQVTHGG